MALEKPAQVIPVTTVERVSFSGTGSDLFAMHAVNVLLSLLTLGIYSCWGRIKLRKYLYARLEFMEQRFAYHGNGRDLLVGFFALGAMLIVPVGLFFYFAMQTPPNETGTTLIIYGTVGALYPFARVGSRRYLLRHLSWSGIRFSFAGSLSDFLTLYVKGILLCLLTLGLYTPIFQAKLHNYLVNNTRFGTVQATSEVPGHLLMGPFLRACLLTPLTLGLVWNYYYASRQRIYMAHTHLGGLSFRCTLTGPQVFEQRLGNGILMLVTLGLGTPWIQARKLRFITSSVQIIGTPDLAAIKRSSTSAQGLDIELDGDFTGLDLDLGL